MKWPAFHLYLGDLLKDPNYRLCTWQAQCAWVKMLLHLHEQQPRGEFRVCGRPMTTEEIATVTAIDNRHLKKLITELLNKGVADVYNGAIANRRMIRERETSEKLSKAGKKGMEKRWHSITTSITDHNNNGITGNITSSSSSVSSSSSISEEEYKNTGEYVSVDELLQKWNTLAGVRKCKRATGTLYAQLAKLCREHPSSWWDEVFGEIPRSRFLSGKVQPREGRSQFTLKLSWLIGPKNLAKVLAGDYDDDRQSAQQRRGVL